MNEYVGNLLKGEIYSADLLKGTSFFLPVKGSFPTWETSQVEKFRSLEVSKFNGTGSDVGWFFELLNS